MGRFLYEPSSNVLWCQVIRFEEEVSGVGPRVGGLGSEWVGVYLVCVYFLNYSIQMLEFFGGDG